MHLSTGLEILYEKWRLFIYSVNKIMMLLNINVKK